MYELKEREEKVIEMHDNRGMTFEKIGRELGISKSRTHQIYRQALRKKKFADYQKTTKILWDVGHKALPEDKVIRSVWVLRKNDIITMEDIAGMDVHSIDLKGETKITADDLNDMKTEAKKLLEEACK